MKQISVNVCSNWVSEGVQLQVGRNDIRTIDDVRDNGNGIWISFHDYSSMFFHYNEKVTVVSE
jgi:hypothetical protein